MLLRTVSKNILWQLHFRSDLSKRFTKIEVNHDKK